MKSKWTALFLAGIFLCSLTAYSHHSFGGTYELGKQVQIEGKLIRVLLRNPHSFIHVEAPDAKGELQEWTVEWTNLPGLAGSNIDRTTLKHGDPVHIWGNPSRTAGQHRMRMVVFKRLSDGLTWGQRLGEVVD